VSQINFQDRIIKGEQLQNHTTFKIGGTAEYFFVAKNTDDIKSAIAWAKSRHLPIFVLGGGSNILVSDKGFRGLVIKNEIKGMKFVEESGDKVRFEIGAGEVWDEIVSFSVVRKYSGLENLSGIPGTVGGAAVQNAGAYGAELKDFVVSVSGVNLETAAGFNFTRTECRYAYRDSIFKQSKKLFITQVTLMLSKKFTPNLSYAGLKDKFADGQVTPQALRDTVLQTRAEKLPDWHKFGTAGSYFKNPIVTNEKYAELVSKYSDLPNFPAGEGHVKIPLGFVLDKICGLKGYKLGPVGLYEKQALVLVNYGGASARDVKNLVTKIKKNIFEKIGVNVEEEVEFIF
jgi:UDP-N-acetylmuramate dehydrogenase